MTTTRDGYYCVPNEQYDEMLSLLKEARTDAVNDRDVFQDCSTNAEGVYSDPEDAEVTEEMDDFIKRLDAVIAKAERDQ